MKNEDIKRYVDITYDYFYASNRFYHLWAKKHGITYLALFALDIVYFKGECAQNAITEKLSAPKQTICSILENFEKKGYIKKKINPSDKRNRLISLTKKGTAFAEPILKELGILETNILKILPREDVKKYTDCQTKIKEFMENYFK